MHNNLTTFKEPKPYGVLETSVFKEYKPYCMLAASVLLALGASGSHAYSIPRNTGDTVTYTLKPSASRADLIKPLKITQGESTTVSAFDMGDIIRYAKLHLGIPDKDLAILFNLSRQHINNYRKNAGNEPHPDTLERAREMFEIIQKLNDIFTLAPSHAIKNVYINNTSLFELLDNKKPDHDRIITFARELESLLVTRRQRHKNSASTDLDRALAIHAMSRPT